MLPLPYDVNIWVALFLWDLISWISLSLPLYNCKGLDCRSYVNGQVVFSTFFNLSLNFPIGAHNLSHSQLPILFLLTMYGLSILGWKKIINLIFVLTTCWCPWIESLLVLLLKSVFYDHHVLLTKLCQSWSCFILHYKAKLAYYSGYLLTSSFAFQFFMMKRKSFPCFFSVLDVGGLVGLHRTGQLQPLWQ